MWTRLKTSLTEGDVATFNAQYPALVVKYTTSFHDHFFILDDVEGYLIRASLKDAGKKNFAITKLEDSSTVGLIVVTLGEQEIRTSSIFEVTNCDLKASKP